MFLHPFLSGIAALLIGSTPMSQFSLADGCLRFAPALRRFAPCRFRFTPPFEISIGNLGIRIKAEIEYQVFKPAETKITYTLTLLLLMLL